MKNSKNLKKSLPLALAIGISVVLSTLVFCTSALAQTAVGTVISNTVTVTWTGGSDTDTETFTVTLKPTAPTLTLVSSTPADLSTVGEGQEATLTYTLQSNANGDDSYNLTVLTNNSTGVNLPATATINGGTTPVSLGASMALSDVTTSNDIVIPGLLADHGLADTETVVIGGGVGVRTITSISNDGTNTTITVDGAAITIDAGVNVYEQISVTVTLSGTTLTGAVAGTYDVTPSATSATDAAATTSDPQTVTVNPVSLTVTKSIGAGSSTIPGGLVHYEILVTNAGSNSAAEVVITDPIPAFTKFSTVTGADVCAVTYSTGGVYDVLPGDPTTVTSVKFTCGTLAGGSSTITVKFDVTID